MKINKAEIIKIELPLAAPFRTGFGVISKREILFLRLFDKNGLVGIGESANMDIPFYEPEFNDASILLLKNYLIPMIVNKNIQSIADLSAVFQKIKGNNFAKTAIESAFWHIQSQLENKPLWALWGGVKSNIPVAISIGLGENLMDSIDRVKKYIETYNPKRVKLKIKPGIDVKLIENIRKKYPHLPIMVDANASFTFKDLDVFKSLDQLDLIMIEQPLAYNDLVDHSLLQKKIKTPICLDESINDLHAAQQAISINACRIINVKPQRVGGYWQAKMISELGQKHGIPVWCGGMIEAGWGQLFNCHIATLPNFKFDNDICLTKWYLADDILESPIPEKDGIINVFATESLFKINQKKFTKYTVNRVVCK
jgi:o-succinylbenzoate synthase